MTGTDIRQTLHVIGHDVDVPAVDAAAFELRVRRARSRRTVGRAGVAALVLATAAVGTVGVAPWAPWQRDAAPAPSVDGADDTNDPDDMAARVDWAPSQLVLVIEGHITITDKDHPTQTRDTGIVAKSVLASTGFFNYVLDIKDHLFTYRLYNDGSPLFGQEGQDETHEPVVTAWADHDGNGVAYVDGSGRVQVIEPGTDEPSPLPLPEWQSPTVAAFSSFGDYELLFASAEGTGLRITTPVDSQFVETGIAATDIDVAGPTIAYQTDEGVQFRGFGGTLRGVAPAVLGALSPDGHWYASTPDPTQGGVQLVNAFRGEGEVTDVDLAAAGPVVDIWWRDLEHFQVVTGSEARTLYDCTLATRICDARLVDGTGTLQLPQD